MSVATGRFINGEAHVPKLSFKHRHGTRTVQLVRLPYSAEAGRSITLTVGAVDIDADPELLPYGIRMVAGQTIEASELKTVRYWLLSHGDQVAFDHRAAWREAFRARVRREVSAELELPPEDGSAFDAASDALRKATDELEALWDDAIKEAKDPWTTLRGPYLAVYKSWSTFADAAKEKGVTKRLGGRRK